MISIAGIEKPAVLAALFNRAGGDDVMTSRDARTLLQGATTFTTINGRSVPVNLSGSSFDQTSYDAAHGAGAAASAVAFARAQQP